MKIKDVIIKEAAPAKVPPQPTLGGKPSTGPKGQAWLQKYGTTHNPDGTPKAAAGPAAQAPIDPRIDPYDPNKDTNVTQAASSDGTTAELDRLKQLAVGGNQPAPAAPEAPAQAAAPTPAPNVNALGVAQTANVATALQPAAQADKPTAQAAQPAPAGVSPDTGLSTAPGQVKTGTGGTTNLTTASQDEYAWRAKNPNWNMTGAQYPGAGNWDPATGRSKQVQAQADANAAAVKGFFNKINPFAKKDQPAAQPAGQGGQPATPPSNAAGAMAAMREADDALLATIRKIR